MTEAKTAFAAWRSRFSRRSTHRRVPFGGVEELGEFTSEDAGFSDTPDEGVPGSTSCGPYDPHVALASPSTTPNPNAMKFTLDVKLPATLNVADATAAVGQPFAEAVFAAGGVASIFGVNDFVTVTRQAGAAWEPIVAAVIAAASTDL